MIPLEEPEIKRDDRTPSVIAQAKAAGWKADYYNFGKAESDNVTYFNPGLVRRHDGLWLIVRRSENVSNIPFGMNSVWAVKLDESGRNPIEGKKLEWPTSEDGQQFEDGRAFYVEHLGQVGVSACTFKWFPENTWTGAIQILGFFDKNWESKILHYVPFESNATSLETVPRERYQKNWLFWIRANRLHLLYKSDPWTVAEFGNSWQEKRVYVNEGAKWHAGEIRGGTPPVLVDGRYITFFHSSNPWRGNYRRYAMGIAAFSPEPPFELIAYTKEPILLGSQNDPWGQRKPPCVFPVGAVLNGDKWLLSLGINDMKAAWLEIPHQDVLKRLGLEPKLDESVIVGNGYVAIPKERGPDDSIVILHKRTPKRGKRGKRGKKKPKRTPEQQAAINARMANLRARKNVVSVA